MEQLDSCSWLWRTTTATVAAVAADRCMESPARCVVPYCCVARA